MSFEFLFKPVEELDSLLTGLFDGAPLLVALGVAFLLGLRHASDPDHLVAVTSLVAAQDGDTRKAARLGAWWGVGHAAALLVIGVPLIAFKAALPGWLESGAEKAIGAVILVLAVRVICKWARGDYRATAHAHDVHGDGHRRRRHLRRGEDGGHAHVKVRTPGQALTIGLLHGLAGTGAVVVLLIAALPSRLEAGLALTVFAPMSIVSMAAFTAAFAWILTRPIIEPIYRTIVIPGMGAFGMVFGLWYAGLG
jgi:ABC-type nickel/cobalt efflux system permease component RcnA